MRSMAIVIGLGGIVFYITLIIIAAVIAKNNVVDLLFAMLGGAFVATIMSSAAFANKQSGEWIVGNLFFALGASAWCWLFAMFGLKITGLWIIGTAAVVFDITIGVIGALILYAARFHSIEQK